MGSSSKLHWQKLVNYDDRYYYYCKWDLAPNYTDNTCKQNRNAQFYSKWDLAPDYTDKASKLQEDVDCGTSRLVWLF